jgi:hypothetical protein
LAGDAVFYRRVQGKEAVMGSLIEEFRRREAAARAGADRLRARIGELAENLARAEEQVSRLAIAGEVVTRLLSRPRMSTPFPSRLRGKDPGETGFTLLDATSRDASRP